MFDLGWSELMVIGVVALVAIGPKDLPHAIYALGKWVRKARVVAREFQGHIDDMMREAELNELRDQAMKARDMNLVKALENSVDPGGNIRASMELPPVTDTTKPADPAATATPTISAPVTPEETPDTVAAAQEATAPIAPQAVAPPAPDKTV